MLVVVAVLSVLGAVATLAQPLLVGQVIERVQLGETLGSLVWVLIALVVVSSLISGYQHYLLQRTGTAVVYSSRRKLIARILHLPISEFDARRTGDLVSRVGTDTTLLYAVLTQGLADAVGNALIFVGALVAMAIIDPILLALIIVVIGVSVVVVVLLSGRIRTASTEQQVKVGELASGVERAVGSIRTVRAAGATDREVAVGLGARDGCLRGRRAHREGLGARRADRRHRAAGLAAGRARGRRLPGRLGRDHDRLARDVHHVPVHADRAARLDVRRDHVGQPGARRARPHPGGARPADRGAERRGDRRARSAEPGPERRGCRGVGIRARRSRSATCGSATPRPSSPRARRPPPRRAPCSSRCTSNEPRTR